MRPRLAAVIALPIAALASALAPANAHAEDAQLERLGWLAGCWAAEKGEAGSVEHWLPLAGGTMLGIGRTVRNGRTVEHEFMQIRLNASNGSPRPAAPSASRTASVRCSPRSAACSPGATSSPCT